MCPFAFAQAAVGFAHFALAAVRAAPVPGCYAGLDPAEVGHGGRGAEVLGHGGLEDGLDVAAHGHAPRRVGGQRRRDAVCFLLGIVLRLSCPAEGELSGLFLGLQERGAEDAAVVGFGDKHVVLAVVDECGCVVSCIACLGQGLPGGVVRVEPFVGIVRVVAARIAQESAGRGAPDAGHAYAAGLAGEVRCGVSAVSGQHVAEGESVIVEAEQDVHPPRPLHRDHGELVAVVAVLAAFAYGQRVAVVDAGGLGLHQFESFGEVCRGKLQAQGRLVDQGAVVAADGVAELAVGEADGSRQVAVGRGDGEVVGTDGKRLHQGEAKQKSSCLHGNSGLSCAKLRRSL